MTSPMSRPFRWLLRWCRSSGWTLRSPRFRRRRADLEDSQARGRRGEALAAARLRADGCRIVGRNRRIAGVEIDVLAVEPGTGVMLVVEVKASADGRPPERRVDAGRRARLIRAASAIERRHAVAIEVIAVDLRAPGLQGVRRIRLEGAELQVSRRGQRGRYR